jgi:hypothetical protein
MSAGDAAGVIDRGMQMGKLIQPFPNDNEMRQFFVDLLKILEHLPGGVVQHHLQFNRFASARTLRRRHEH